MSYRKYTIDTPTTARTPEELQIDFENYILSKTVNGIYCVTPDFGLSSHDDEETGLLRTTSTKKKEDNE